METLAELLGSHEDYSLFSSLEHIKSVTETNPGFELTLKTNAECGYCRSYIYENAKYLYLPEMKLLYSEIRKSLASNADIDTQAIREGVAAILERFFSIPLKDMKKEVISYSEAVSRAAKLIDDLIL